MGRTAEVISAFSAISADGFGLFDGAGVLALPAVNDRHAAPSRQGDIDIT
jgi:hypothetical protein